MPEFNPTFSEIDTSLNTPQDRVEINDTTATGLPSTKKRILLLAPKLAAGSAADAQLVKNLTDEADVNTYFGKIAKRLANRIFVANPLAPLDAIAIAEAGGGAAATGSIVFATAADVDGNLELWFGDFRVDVTISVGMTPAQIVTAAVAAMTAEADCPFAGVANVATLELTCAVKGTIGNYYRVAAVLPTGIATTAVVTQPTGGATDPTFSATYADVFKNLNYDLVVVPWCFSGGSLTALKNTAIYMANAARNNGAMHFVGLRDTYANAITAQASYERRDFVLLWQKSTDYWPMPPHDRAAYEAGIVSSESDPSVPFVRDARPEVIAPFESGAVAPTAAEIEGCLSNGITPDVSREDGTTEVVELISTATKLSGGAASQAWASPHVWFVLKYIRKAAVTRLQTAYSTRASRKLVDGKLGDVKGVLLDLLKELAEKPLEYISKAALLENLANVVVRQNTTNPKFIDIGLPAAVIQDYRGANVVLFLTIPTLSAAA
jgi:phage tail sheath gpL-like